MSIVLAGVSDLSLAALVIGAVIIAVAAAAVLTCALRRSDFERWRTRQSDRALRPARDSDRLSPAQREQLARLVGSLRVLQRHRRRRDADGRTAALGAGTPPAIAASPPSAWVLGGAVQAEIARLHSNLVAVAVRRSDAEAAADAGRNSPAGHSSSDDGREGVLPPFTV